MAPFRTWVIAGLVGALCATVWLGAFTFPFDHTQWWHVAGSALTFTVAVAILAWNLRPSQVAHAVPAVSAGYAVGWDIVQDTRGDAAFTVSPYLIVVLALAAATVIALVVARVKDGPETSTS